MSKFKWETIVNIKHPKSVSLCIAFYIRYLLVLINNESLYLLTNLKILLMWLASVSPHGFDCVRALHMIIN